MVSVCKHTYYGSSRALNPKLVMHAYGHVCKMKNWTPAHKAISYEMIDNLGEIAQQMYTGLTGLYLLYCSGSRSHSLLALRTNLGATAILAKL